MISILQMGKRRLREIRWLAQDHTASKEHRQNSYLGLHYFEENILSIISQVAFTRREYFQLAQWKLLPITPRHQQTLLRAVVPENEVLMS